MEVTLTQTSPILKTAEVKLPWERVKAHYTKALKELAKTVDVPGFRKGKAPAVLLKKRFGDYLIGDVVQKVAPETIDTWIKENKVKYVGQPRIADVDAKVDQYINYTVELDVMPTIELGEWEGLEAETLKIDVSGEQLDQHLNMIVEQSAETNNVEDRGMEDGDVAHMNLTAMDVELNEIITDLDQYRLDTTTENPHPVLSEQLKGKTAGEDFEFEVTGAEDETFEEWRGKTVRVMGEIERITRTTKPELNDDFAKSKEYESLDDMRAKESEKLQEQAVANEKGRVQSTLISELLDGQDFQIPDSVVQQEAEMMVQSQYGQFLQGQDEAMQKQAMQYFTQMTLPQAEMKARGDVILDAVADKAGIEVDDDAINEELKKYQEMGGPEADLEKMREQFEAAGILDTVIDMLRRSKAADALYEAAKLTEVDELTQPEPPEDEVVGVPAEDAVDMPAEDAAETAEATTETPETDTEASESQDKDA